MTAYARRVAGSLGRRSGLRIALAVGAACLACSAESPVENGPLPAEPTEQTGGIDRTRLGLSADGAKGFASAYLTDAPVLVLPGVFEPAEAETKMLPFMREHPDLFAGKRVLEIGTGTGIISVYAAKLGATKVVATDISGPALDNARRNARRFGVEEIVETRLVSTQDPTAYAVIGAEERFDTLISNPPYSLDLDAPANSAVTDAGDLGFSIVRGLARHLAPDGTAVLMYASYFYHHVMAKFAAAEGYRVTRHEPFFLSVLEAETLFNAYLSRLLVREGVARDAFRFDLERDASLQRLRVEAPATPPTSLVPPRPVSRWYHGMLVVRPAGSDGGLR